MRRFISLLVPFLILLRPEYALAIVSPPSPSLKDYCNGVAIQSLVYDTTQSQLKVFLTSTLGPTNDPDIDNAYIGIKTAEFTGSNNTAGAITPNISPFTYGSIGSQKVVTIQMGDFFKQNTKGATTPTKFDMKLDKNIASSKGIDTCSSTTTSQQQVVIQPQAPATAVPAPVPSASPPSSGVSAPGLIYCDAGASKLSTAIGCIPVRDTNGFISFVIGWFIGISGGIAFLLIVWSGFQIMTAAGNPEQLQKGRETLTSAISGLILIIFSVFLLKLIGINILGIPGLI